MKERLKFSNISLIGITEEEEREMDQKQYFKKIIIQKVPEPMNHTNLHIQEAQYSLIWVNKKKLIPLQMVTAAMELKDIYSLERKL